jgi:hypothetical protein
MEQKLTLRTVLTYLLAYAVWLIASAGGILEILLFRAALNQSYILAYLPREAFHFIDRSMLFVFGTAWVFLMVLGEGYFRDGAAGGDLKRRIIRVLGSEVVLAVILYLIPVAMAVLKSL